MILRTVWPEQGKVRARWGRWGEKNRAHGKTSHVIVGEMGSPDVLGYRRDFRLTRPPVGAMWTTNEERVSEAAWTEEVRSNR